LARNLARLCTELRPNRLRLHGTALLRAAEQVRMPVMLSVAILAADRALHGWPAALAAESTAADDPRAEQ
jgi:hypothetical protein